jgi:hypothetical protein
MTAPGRAGAPPRRLAPTSSPISGWRPSWRASRAWSILTAVGEVPGPMPEARFFDPRFVATFDLWAPARRGPGQGLGLWTAGRGRKTKLFA